MLAPRVQIAKFAIHRFIGFRRDLILAARVCEPMPRVENPAWEQRTLAVGKQHRRVLEKGFLKKLFFSQVFNLNPGADWLFLPLWFLAS